MKKYVTFVKDEATSRQVQTALYKAGFRWCGQDDHEPRYCSSRFIFIDGQTGRMTYHDSSLEHIAKQLAKGDEIVSAGKIIKDPFQLDGAKKPEVTHTINGKEYSESTIQAALREYVS